MTVVGFISDTHNHLPEEAKDRLRGCERILHAGDIGEPPILWELEAIAPVNAVLGNNDHSDFGPSVHAIADVLIDGVRFVVVHEPAHLSAALRQAASAHHGSTAPIVAVYGHKHVPALRRGEASDGYELLLSPGSVFRSREELGRRTVGKAEVRDGAILRAWIEDLDGNVLTEA